MPSDFIEADDDASNLASHPNNAPALSAANRLESGGIAGLLQRSAHPLALTCLYLFRTAAIVVYILCGLFTDNYVLSIVVVVVLLSLDFWNTRNIAGRILVGLRYFNEVNEEGESSWVFESRDPSYPANAVDAKMFWLALYAYCIGWLILLCISLVKFNVSFLPIVILALVFNVSNLLGFTYADRDAQRMWATASSSGGYLGFGTAGVGGQLLNQALRSGLGRVMG